MGERQSDGSAPGRRRVHPGGTVSGPEDRLDGSVLEVLLAGAMRPEALDDEAEQRAVAAFRAARDAGTHRARTRRRDDWRPRERRSRRSLKATLTLALAGLTVGGVAFAAIGTGGHSSDDGHAARQREHRPVGASASGPGTPGSAATPDRPVTANDTEAHCKAYEKKLDGKGKALDSTAWQRLIAAAGGEQNVAAYCAEQLGRTAATPSASKPGNSDKSGKTGKADKTEDSGSSGKSGSGQQSGKDNGKNN
ncbi:hypothetical protein ACFY1L_08745 [Streptomyces sp. NPDC001663]|uniref:hypothetical protein n=1 Tax=Streptomyces sp. NPDC001663 TaxID=3364597 RepID=UPI0036CB4E07